MAEQPNNEPRRDTRPPLLLSGCHRRSWMTIPNAAEIAKIVCDERRPPVIEEIARVRAEG